MLQIFNTQEGRLQQISTIVPNSWLKLINPSKRGIENISTKCDIPVELIQAALNINERSRIQQKDGATLILTQIAHANDPDNVVPYRIMPLGIIMTSDMIVTVSLHDNPIYGTIEEEYFDDFIGIGQTQFIYRLLEIGADHFIDSIEIVDSYIDEVERELQRSIKNTQVFDLLNNNKSLILFANALKNNATILDDLITKKFLIGNELTDKLLLDIQVETEQAQVMSETHNANLRNLMDAYSAAIENNLSLLVQYLSIYVIFLAIPLGIAGIYGMNTPLPIQDEPYALSLLMFMGLILGIGIAIVFKIRKII